MTDTTHDVSLAPHTVARFIARDPNGTSIFLLEFQGNALCFLRQNGDGHVTGKTLDLANAVGSGTSLAYAALAALNSVSQSAAQALKVHATALLNPDPAQRGRVRGQIEMLLAEHDQLAAEVKTLGESSEASRREQEAQEEKALGWDDDPTPF